MLPKYKISKPFDYRNDCMYANEEPLSFWNDLAKKVHWDKEYDQLYSGDELKPDWFKGGMLNTCYNVLDRNIKDPEQRERYALIYECPYLKQSVKIKYIELYEKVCKLSGALVSLGVTQNDAVIIYMPTGIEGYVSMLSCARIGATHSVVYGGHNEYNLTDRIDNCFPKVIILSNYGFSNNEIVPYTPNIIKALELSTFKPNHLITFNRNDHFDKEFISSIPKVPGSLDMDELLNNSKPFYGYIPVESSHPLYVIYTSGTSGKPKGIVRDNASHLVSNLYYFNILCPGERPIIFSPSNIGWVSGHCCLYNTLGLGGTFNMFEGITTLSNHEIEFWEIIEKYSVKYLFLSPSAIRTIMKYDPEAKSIKKHDISSLESIWVGGEVSYEPGLNYIRNIVGKRIYNIMGQTEASIPLIMSFHGNQKENKIGIAPPYINLNILSENGEELKDNEIGELVIKLPLPPGFATTLYNDEKGFYNNYFSTYKGYYNTGDLATRDEDGYYNIVSRADDVITVSTFKIKSTSVENSILKHPKIVSCSCIGIPDEIKGEVPIAFVVLKDDYKIDIFDFQMFKDEINKLVVEKNGYYATLQKLIIVNKLPTTRSGKNTKSVLKKIININDFIIPLSVEEPEIFNEILTIYKKQKVY
ncbi:hypothetical protein DICPUDRAFT_92742 [Dictyostelium purpureum]|uniref:AMP-dependent synthetase/ligase domain-containing protein n=1 Tax=Dictyostelium purpureum TaxID=5786 RepID=F0ZWM4_DICPU|nr:uncharacterized protein DICPUDRAFT_92742 [Dictyostelium purpureum]EGC31650.1 hypothetical protein DICPUDRAFT_92742 [Dictyostelium purpureum]|eukprot:XP_003291816.1 hypothetical protein DICPUDRAFT_92742 [Dictyostelium purpureum]